ncbi:hypothetical protein [Hymenobacter algoricola]|uniref:DUF1772 domain-containing protein n=1 Tax=Hymenobacter algoricola TaxID=486267 RepID=A0ABP7N9G6_9BACT
MLWHLLAPIVLLVGALVYAGIEAGSNAYQIQREYDVSHLWETRGRMTALGFMAALASFSVPDLWSMLHAAAGFFMAACAFGFWFDLTLNRRRGLSWYYVGIDPQTAGIDKAITRHRIPGKLYQAGKAAGALLLLGLLLWLRL